ncbi:MAG: sodium-dependent transporter [Victivallaceae bacterium]
MAERENWGSRIGFVLAISGAAIGLGNVWKFPYVAGMNGGGAFVLMYIFCIALCGLPLLIGELVLGRRTGKNPVAAFGMLEDKNRHFSESSSVLFLVAAICMVLAGRSSLGALALLAAMLLLYFGFAAVGVTAVVVSALILSYYSVIGGWIFEYACQSFAGKLNFSDVAAADQVFGNFITQPMRITIWHFLFLLAASAMIWLGIRKGIERWSKFLMPTMVVLFLILIIRGLTLPGALDGVSFFLTPDFGKLTPAIFLEALGHSFYTLSLGMGITITYGSYLKKSENLYYSALMVVFFDTLFALLAGLAIFPAVFAMGFQPDAGPSLIFKVLPAAFNSIPGNLGWLWSGIFFLIMLVAAVTSAAALLECIVSCLIDQTKISRKKAVILTYLVVGCLGILSAMSINNWNNLPKVHKILIRLFGKDCIPGNWFDLLDFLTTYFMVPLSGLFTVLFIGWVWGIGRAGDELRQGIDNYSDCSLWNLFWYGLTKKDKYLVLSSRGITPITLWTFTVKWISPIIIAAIFIFTLNKIGLLAVPEQFLILTDSLKKLYYTVF